MQPDNEKTFKTFKLFIYKKIILLSLFRFPLKFNILNKKKTVFSKKKEKWWETDKLEREKKGALCEKVKNFCLTYFFISTVAH